MFNKSINQSIMFATSRKIYTKIFKISMIYMLEIVIETSSVSIFSDYYHTNLRGRGREEDVKEMQETFHAKSER